MVDPVTMALSEAMFRGQASAPNSDEVDRAWAAISPREGYRAAIVRSQLRMLGYDLAPTSEDSV
jgi:hypothetical protein